MTEPTLADDLRELDRILQAIGQETAKLRGSYDEVQSRLTISSEALDAAQAEMDVLEQVTSMLQGLEASWQKNFQASVAKVISRGLTLVFEEPMELKIIPKVRADVTTVDFKIVQGEGDDAIETNILGAKGGTVIALVNVLVRALLVLSARPPMARVLWLDEPFGLADDSYIPAFGTLLRELCDRLGFRIFIISHEEALVDVADVAYEAYKTKKKGTAFRQIRSRHEAHA